MSSYKLPIFSSYQWPYFVSGDLDAWWLLVVDQTWFYDPFIRILLLRTWNDDLSKTSISVGEIDRVAGTGGWQRGSGEASRCWFWSWPFYHIIPNQPIVSTPISNYAFWNSAMELGHFCCYRFLFSWWLNLKSLDIFRFVLCFLLKNRYW